jgi:hypothetical protein
VSLCLGAPLADGRSRIRSAAAPVAGSRCPLGLQQAHERPAGGFFVAELPWISRSRIAFT